MDRGNGDCCKRKTNQLNIDTVNFHQEGSNIDTVNSHQEGYVQYHV